MAPDMEFATDLTTSLRSRIGACGDASAPEAIDWHSLQTRFAAAHAARRELARTDSGPVLHSGGFGEWSGLHGMHGHASRNINPIDLAVRKGPAGMDGVVAEQAVGGRG